MARLGTGTANRQLVIPCASCGVDVPDGGAHVVLSEWGPDHHALFCPPCCPCVRTPEVIK